MAAYRPFRHLDERALESGAPRGPLVMEGRGLVLRATDRLLMYLLWRSCADDHVECGDWEAWQPGTLILRYDAAMYEAMKLPIYCP
jgi:hypothetical protein